AMGFTPPLLLIVLHETLVRRERSAVWCGVMLGLVCAAQLLIGLETLAGEAIFVVVALLLLGVVNYRVVGTYIRRLAAFCAIGLAVFVVVDSWALWVMFTGSQHITNGLLQAPNVYVVDAANIVLPVHQLISYGAGTAAQFTGNISEN